METDNFYFMESIKCSKGYEMSRVGRPEDRMRRVCMYQEKGRKDILRTLVDDAGGTVSDGICQEHFKMVMAEVAKA